MQRKIKNVVKNYTASEIKVREATSNDPWGPSSILMSEIATLTFDALARSEIMPIIWKRLNDHGKNWRHVYKSLVLLEYLVRTGSDQVVRQCKDNIILVQTLREFQYVENGLDCGLNVREAAKSLFDLLKDEEKLKNERTRAVGSKSRFGDMWGHPSSAGELAISSGSYNSERKYRPFTTDTVEIERHADRVHSPIIDEPIMNRSTAMSKPRQAKSKDPEIESSRPSNQNEEELQLQLALAMSKEEHEADMRKRKGEEIKLQMAIEESKKTAEQEKIWRKASPFDLEKRASSDALVDPWGGPGVAPRVPRDPWKSSPGEFDIFSSNSKSNDDLLAAPAYSTVHKTTMSSLQSTPWEEAAAKFSQPSVADDFLEISNRHAANVGKAEQPNADSWFPSSNASTGARLDNLLEDLWGTGPSKGVDGSAAGSDDASGFEIGGDLLKGAEGQQSKGKTAKKITPEEFLGPNAKLVDLNELVSKPKQPDNWNPFSMTTQTKGPVVNPFVVKAQQEEKSKRVPLNQLQSSVGNPSNQLGQSFNFDGSSFGQSQQSAVQANQLSSFSTPSLALMYTPQPIAQNQNYNPFL